MITNKQKAIVHFCEQWLNITFAHTNKELTKQLGIFLIILGFITFTGLSIYITFVIDAVFGISALGVWFFITGSIICLIMDNSDI